MPYRVELTKRAARDLRGLPRGEQARVARAIDGLAGDPRPHGYRKLEGSDDLYRVRVGNYRVIYTGEDDVLVVLVIRIGDRRDVYR